MNFMKKIVLWLNVGIVLISFLISAKAQSNAEIIKLSKETLDEAATESGPGAVVLIARGNKVVFNSARGMANIELGVPLSTNQIFRIASITKMFTAALVIKLSEAGELSLDDNLSKFLPDFPGAKSITIRQLLNHTAGISDQIPAEFRLPGFSRRDVDTAALIAEIAKRPSSFSPGSDQAYSNAGYILLGAVIEKVTGKPWYAALQERLLTPLGLKNTTYGIASKILPGRVEGYTTNTPNRLPENAPFISLSTPAAAGALVSTLDDLRNWMRFLVDGRVISKAGFEQMITSAIVPGKEFLNPYGFGIYIWRVRGETMIGHTGQINGFASVLVYLPSKDITIVALGNNDNFDAQNFGRRIAAIALGKPFSKVKSVPISGEDLQAIAGKYRDGEEIRIFLAKDGKLYSQREGRNPFQMQMTSDKQLHFLPDELSYFLPIKDSSGKVIRLDYYFRGEGPPRRLLKIE